MNDAALSVLINLIEMYLFILLVGLFICLFVGLFIYLFIDWFSYLSTAAKDIYGKSWQWSRAQYIIKWIK